MTKRRIIYAALLLLLTLAAYEVRRWATSDTGLSAQDRELIARSCAGEGLDAAHPLLASDAVDRRMTERYGEVCRSLTLDPHLHFGVGLDVYQCRIWIPRSAEGAGNQQQTKALDTFFGRREFDLGAYPRKAGTEATVLLVTDDGEDVAAITDQAGLRAALAQVKDLQGAAELITLLNDTGRLVQPPALCGLAVTGDAGGWTLGDVRVPENCATPWWRSYRVERNGAVQVLSSVKRWWRFDSAVCSD
ncbi:MAG TPA: hypothetical protein VM639_05680 [Dongiaceae bacterium]|nr:hypothetical protein [Dongiaceae bacterium]